MCKTCTENILNTPEIYKITQKWADLGGKGQDDHNTGINSFTPGKDENNRRASKFGLILKHTIQSL